MPALPSLHLGHLLSRLAIGRLITSGAQTHADGAEGRDPIQPTHSLALPLTPRDES